MSKYNVWVCLEMEDIIEADSPEEAFETLSDGAVDDGTWEWSANLIEEDKDFNSTEDDYEYACELKFD